MKIVKSTINYQMAKNGVKIIHIGPLGPNYSEKEWMKWLDYIPKFQKERMEYLSEKPMTELTDSEIEELRSLRKELKIRDIAKNYENNKTSIEDRLEYIEYTTQENLDSIIHKKLTTEEYKNGVVRIKKIIDTLSYEELKQYCESTKNNFDNLSMIDLFVLREVNRVFLVKADEKSRKQLSYQLERNEIMRHQSMIEASKHIIL